MYRKTGVITLKELKSNGLLPPRERMLRGPVAVAECPEEIPCNVCASKCPSNAVKVEGLRGKPKIDWERCTGCGVCVGFCPGLAFFVVDLSKSPALVTVPHEFLPRPEPGLKVSLLSRDGKRVGKGRVVKVFEVNKTLVVTVEVPRELAMEVRAVWVD
ncbi:MAG TPA: ferredoxin [Thermofilum sp.]|nr:ferredoxin [Thermofilum sp.]